MKLEELFFISLTKSEMAIEGFNPTKICTWFLTPFTMIGFCRLPLIIPEMYLKTSSRQGT